MWKTPRPPLALILLTISMFAAWALRLYHLAAQSLWVDEGFSYEVARQGIRAILTLLPAEDRHPPLHYLLLWLNIRLAGPSEFSLRFLSAAIGLLALPFAYRVGQILGGRPVGLVAAILLAVSPMHVWYSQEARMYALLTSLGLASFFFWLLAHTKGGRLNWVGYVIATAGALYTHYYGVFLLPAHVLTAMLLKGKGARGWELEKEAAIPEPGARKGHRWVLAPTLAFLAFTPWLAAIWQQYRRAPTGYQPELTLLDVLWNVVTTYVQGEHGSPAVGTIVVFGLIALLGVLPTVDADKGSRAYPAPRAGLILVLWMLAAPVGAYVGSTIAALDIRATGRMYYVAGLPAFLLLVARGLFWLDAAIRRRLLRANWHAPLQLAPATLLGLVVVAVVQAPVLHRQYVDITKEDFRSAAHFIEFHEWPGDSIILNAEYIFRPFAYYYRGASPWHRAIVEADRVEAALAEQTNARKRVWLVLSHDDVADPERRVQRWLDHRATLLDEQWFPGVHLRLYGLEPRPRWDRPVVGRELGIRLADRVEIVGVDTPTDAVGGETVRLKVIWHALAPLTEDYHVALMLADADGQVWGQIDRIPISPFYQPTQWQPGEYLTDRYEIRLPLGLPPGDYRLDLKFYAPSDGRALAPPGGGDTTTLGTLHVGRSVPPEPLGGVRLSPALDLIQATLDRTSARPGERVLAELLWQAIAAPSPTTQVVIRLVDGQGTKAAEQIAPPVGGVYPPDRWQVGEVVRDRQPFTLPGRAPAGTYTLQVGLADEGRQPSTFYEIGQVEVEKIARSYELPAIEYAQSATLGESIAFVGYDLDSTMLHPGATLRLTLYWRALGEPQRDYTVFTHLVGPDERIYGQRDTAPVAGTRPTTSWLRGEVIRDVYDIPLDASAPTGTYYVAVGMYRPDTGERLPLADGETRLILGERIQVVAKE